MMTLGQSETWSGVNYRMMTQARYGAESGLNAAANFLGERQLRRAPGRHVLDNGHAQLLYVDHFAGDVCQRVLAVAAVQ